MDDDDGPDEAFVDELVEHLLEDHGFDERKVTWLLTLGRAIERAANAILQVSLEQGLDPDDLEALTADEEQAALAQPLHELFGGIDTEVVDALTSLLGDQETSVAIVHDVVGADPLAAATMLALVDVADLDLDRRARANRHWLRARLLEFVADDHSVVEPELRRALDLDAGHGEALFDLARYRADRSEAGAALGLLRQLEDSGGDRGWLDVLERYAEPGPTSASRNDPCPCGSGRKHKVCCAPRNGWPVESRVDWIHDKIARFAASAPVAYLLDAVLDVVGLRLQRRAWDDLALTNLLLFDAGVIAEFAELRGPLLPADELELVRELAEVRAGAYEVVDVEPGQGLVALDQGTGERIELDDVSLSSNLEVGDLVLAWIAPTPDGFEPVTGVINVPLRAHESLLALLDEDAGASDLAIWYDSLHDPPTLTNSDGEPLVLCTAVYRVTDPAAARAVLSEVLEAQVPEGGPLEGEAPEGEAAGPRDGVSGGERLVLIRTVERDDGQVTIRGTARVEGDTVTIEANSLERIDALHDLIEELLPDAELLDEWELPAEELLEDDDPYLDDDDGFDDLFDDDDLDGEDLDWEELGPEQRAELEGTLDAWMAGYEDRWLDMPIPALGGATPREAADDPTRRGTLELLLREFDDAGSVTGQGRGMDPDRLRELLGLQAP
ncbi:MAG TPA: SEC-C domain-containing protein [Nitriliruptorales bacterium]